MQFDIVSIGDAAFLEQILISVAMVTSANSFEQMVSIGLLLGVFFVMVQSVFQGAKQINYHQILVGYLLYACFFIPTATVTIEDSVTGEIRVVSNVPLGVAAPGGIISTIGYNITNLFEQGYGAIVPYVTDTNFAESLQLLNNVRWQVSSTPVYAALNATQGGNADIRESWHNYIRECTLTGVDLGDSTVDKIMESKMPDGLEFRSQIYGTKIYTGSLEGEYLNCTEAFAILKNVTVSATNSGNADLSDAIYKALGMSEEDITYGATAQNSVNSSLGILGATSTAATDYLVTAILEPIYLDAAKGRYSDFQDIASATMLNQAIQQRNTQWAAEQSMFMTIARPMMTFFEGFVYAVTPFIGFLIVLGSFGMSLAGKYFQTLIWIQLWMPVLSIINLYIHTAASRGMSSLGGNLDSFYALNKSTDVLQNWLATGGMLAASTPIISLFIVTGSTYAFTSLVGRIGGQDHIDEGIQSKEALKNGPVMQAQSSLGYSDVGGMVGSGAPAVMGEINFGSEMSNSVSSSKESMEQAQQAFSSALGQTFSSSKADSQTYSQAAALGRAHNATHGSETGIIANKVNQFMKSTGLGAEYKDAVTGSVAVAASGNAELGAKMLRNIGSKGNPTGEGDTGSTGAGLGGKVAVGAEKTANNSSSRNRQLNTSVADALQFSDGEKSSITNALSDTFTSGNQHSLSSVLGEQNTEALMSTAQDVSSTAEKYQEASSLATGFGSRDSIGVDQAGMQVSRNQSAMGGLNEYMRTGGVTSQTKQEAQKLFQKYSAPTTENGHGMSEPAALAAANIKALMNSGNHSDTNSDQYTRNANAALKALGEGLGISTSEHGGYDRYSDKPEVSNPGLRQAAGGAAAQAASQTGAAKGLNVGGFSDSPEYKSPNSAAGRATPTRIDNEHADNRNRVINSANSQQAAAFAANEASAWTDYKNSTPPDKMSAVEFFGGVNNMKEWSNHKEQQAVELGQSLFAAGKEGAKAASAGFSSKLEELQNNPEARAEAIAASKMSDEEYANSSFSGKALSHLSSAGRAALGVAATGMELATGKMSVSDLKGHDVSELGAVYQAAGAYAAQEGGEAGKEAFNSVHKTDFQQLLKDKGVSQGLTEDQAMVFATSYGSGNKFDISDVRTYGLQKFLDPNSHGGSVERTEAIRNIAMGYAEKDADGNAIMENGSPVLTPENQEKVTRMVSDITNSTRASKEITDSQLTAIAHYNQSTGKTVDRFSQ